MVPDGLLEVLEVLVEVALLVKVLMELQELLTLVVGVEDQVTHLQVTPDLELEEMVDLELLSLLSRPHK